MTATPSREEAIQARVDAATPGPWWGGGDRSKRGSADRYGLVGRLSDRGTGNAIAVLSGVGMDRVADAEFIAHAREDIPYLLAKNAELRTRIDQALACYGPDPSLGLGVPRYRSADAFLIAIRAALTTEVADQ